VQAGELRDQQVERGDHGDDRHDHPHHAASRSRELPGAGRTLADDLRD
jgi:hypothetical protein